MRRNRLWRVFVGLPVVQRAIAGLLVGGVTATAGYLGVPVAAEAASRLFV